MLDDTAWTSVEHALNNFPVMMGGIMMLASARATAGEDPSQPVQDPGPTIRALVRERLGKPQLDPAAAQRVRRGLTPDDARLLLEACADFASDLPPITGPLTEEQMLAYIARAGPGDPAFDAFMQRFMPLARKIQEIYQQS